MKKLILLFLAYILYIKSKKDKFAVKDPNIIEHKEKFARKIESLKIYLQMQLERLQSVLKNKYFYSNDK